MNLLVAVSGPSGSGKSSVMSSVMSSELVSLTTRQPREGEIDGKTYYFTSPEKYQELLHSGSVIESSGYMGKAMYGMTAHEFHGKLAQDNSFWIVDLHGMTFAKQRYSNTISIFVYADKQSCIDNMKARGDSEDKIAERIATYEFELQNRQYYDYVIKNVRGHINETIGMINNILHANV